MISKEEIREIYSKETGADLDLALPEKGFLKDYYDFAKELTDAPEHYHIFGGLSVLSAVVGNNIHLPFGPWRIYPNLWIVLLAPSSIFRKSTVITIVRKIITAVDNTIILPNEFTPEVLVSSMEKNPQGILIWSEFASALSNFERSYMMGTKEFLTDIYDCPPIYRRKIREKEFTIENPCISILAGTAIDWFLSKCKEGDVRGGFLARFVYVPATAKTKRISIPPPYDPKELNHLSSKLKIIKEITGTADIKGIESIYDKWAIGHDEELERETDQERLSGFFTRLSIYALKFAMLYQLAQDQSVVISDESMTRAISLTHYLKRNVRRLVKEEFVFGKEEKQKKKLLDCIRRNPGITKRIILQRTKMTLKTLEPILITLITEGSVRVEKGSYYPCQSVGDS
jgi:hypothetical protein